MGEEAELSKAMEIPFHIPGCGVSSLARAGGGTLGNMFTELLPNHRKSRLLGMENGRRRRRQMWPRLCQLLSAATGKQKPEHRALLCPAMWDAGGPGVFSLCCFISEQLGK